MKDTLLLLFSILLLTPLVGQYSEKYVELDAGSYTSSFEVCQGAYILGTFGNDDSRIYIIDDDMVVLDEIKIPKSDYNLPVSIHCLGDSLLLVALQNSMILQYDLTSKKFTQVDSFANQTVDRHTLYEVDRFDDEIIAFGTSQSYPDSAGRFKYFEMGYNLNLINDQLSKTELPATPNYRPHFMDAINNDSILLLQNSEIGTFLDVLDSNFKIMQSIYMGEQSIYRFKYISSQEIYFQGLCAERSYIYKSNIQNKGGVIYEDTSRKFIAQIIKEKDNLIVGLNYNQKQADTSEKYIDILKMDTSGNVFWSYTLQTSFAHSFHEMKLVDDNKLIIAGTAQANSRDIANYKPFICEIDLTTVSTEDKRIVDIPVNIFPNPANSTIHFVSDEAILKVLVYNQKGSLVKTMDAFSNEMQIGYLPAGVYYIQVQTESGVYTRKLVKD